MNWFTGQFFRVTRQHETEQFLKTIVDRQKALTSSISVLTKRIEEALRSKEPTLTIDIVRDVAQANLQVAEANSAVIEVLSNLPWEPTGNFPFQATQPDRKIKTFSFWRGMAFCGRLCSAVPGVRSHQGGGAQDHLPWMEMRW